MALGNFDESARIAKMGLLSSPRDFMLKNNLAFALVSLDRVQDALETLGGINEGDLKDSEKATLIATRGTVAFREGNVESGRALYKSSIESFKKEKDLRSETLATFFWAREEERIKSPWCKGMKDQVTKIAKRLNIVELLPPSEKEGEAFSEAILQHSEKHIKS